MIDKTLADRLGGKPVLEKVHKLFYDKVFADPWLSKYFMHQPRDVLESQQTDFMLQLMGGPKRYAGQTPKVVHGYILITEELFDLRSRFLSESIQEMGIADDLRQEWMAANDTFKKALVKNTPSDCKFQYAEQAMLRFAK